MAIDGPGVTWHLDFKFALTIASLLLVNIVGGAVYVTTLEHRVSTLETEGHPIDAGKLTSLSERMIRVEIQGTVNGKALTRIDQAMTLLNTNASRRWRLFRSLPRPSSPTAPGHYP